MPPSVSVVVEVDVEVVVVGSVAVVVVVVGACVVVVIVDGVDEVVEVLLVVSPPSPDAITARPISRPMISAMSRPIISFMLELIPPSSGGPGGG